jgi:mitochondrial fission protein ELM1
MDSEKLVIWFMSDNKPGHENQTQGLIEALRELRPISVYRAPVAGAFKAVSHALFRSYPMQNREQPHLVIGAGHRTHLSILAASRATGAQSVVLMKPSLPRQLFDYCIVPEHDGLQANDHLITTKGVLNRIKSVSTHESNRGLLLIGGPSSHYDWEDNELLKKIKKIIDHDNVDWILATSRRTPDNFMRKLKEQSIERLEIVPANDTSSDWLPAQLSQASKIWITEDSVSMVYEALSSGARCGLLPVPRKRANRVSLGIDQLLHEQYITSFEQWEKTGELSAHHAPLNEAGRVAKLLLESINA